MQTDLILKRLTELYAADILSLFGLPVAEVLSVETLEMAANAARLDNLVKVRSPQGQEYWHIIEWQGYRDPTILWRVLGYVVRTGQRNPQVAITASIVYLTPECDMGDTIQTRGGRALAMDMAGAGGADVAAGCANPVGEQQARAGGP